MRLVVSCLAVASAFVGVARGQTTRGGVAAPAARGWFADDTARARDVKLAPFQDREGLWLRNNTVAWLPDGHFSTGTIELDVAMLPPASFFGIVFRRHAAFDEENVYFRPPMSGLFHALQYAPHVRGSSTWQLYPQFTSPLVFERERWSHVRLAVGDSTLVVFVGSDTTPRVVVPRLRGTSGEGTVGVWARVTNQPSEWAAVVSNMRVHSSTLASSASRPSALDLDAPGIVRSWDVTNPVAFDSTRRLELPALTEWQGAATEERGLLNLTKRFGRQPRAAAVFARTIVEASRAGTALLDLGYSDDATVFVNGTPIFAGRNGWESRYPGYLGMVNLGNDQLVLPLKAGRNEVIVRLVDDNRFGWGLIGRLVDQSNIVVRSDGDPPR